MTRTGRLPGTTTEAQIIVNLHGSSDLKPLEAIQCQALLNPNKDQVPDSVTFDREHRPRRC